MQFFDMPRGEEEKKEVRAAAEVQANEILLNVRREYPFVSYSKKMPLRRECAAPPYDYKLHISLSKREYAVYNNEITLLLMRAIKEGAIDIFKATLADELEECFLESQQDFERHGVRSTQYETLVASERLLNGAQFTVYIPKSCNQQAILDLCRAINSILICAQPGVFSDVESLLTNNLSFRQDFLNGSYVDACLFAPLESVSIEAVEARGLLKRTQEEADLFRYLNAELETNPLPPSYIYTPCQYFTNQAPLLLFPKVRESTHSIDLGCAGLM